MEETGMNYLWSARKRNALGLPWTFTKYAFTEDRLFVTTGLLKTVEDEVRLYRIEVEALVAGTEVEVSLYLGNTCT